jgi:signal peptidase I
MSSLIIALGLSLVGVAVLYIQINPSVIYGTENVQVLAVASGSMEPTIMKGNYVLVDKQVNPRELSADYPNSDIIAFHEPSNIEDIIVHRIVAEEERAGTLYFRTKGDANGINKYPDIPTPADYDPWQTNGVPGVSEDLVVGKVVNNNYPFMLFTIGFWLMVIISIVLGITLVAFSVSIALKKRQSRIRQLEERVRRLEAEKG